MAKVALGPQAQAVWDAAMGQIGPQLETIIAQICTAAGYQQPQAAAQSYAAQVSGAYATAAAQSYPALPPAGGGGCSTGACGTNSMVPQRGGNGMGNGKSCCGSCASGSGQCSCSAESLGCSIGDTINPVRGWAPTSTSTGAPVAGAECVLPPGFVKPESSSWVGAVLMRRRSFSHLSKSACRYRTRDPIRTYGGPFPRVR